MEKIDRENVLKNKIDSIRQDDFAHDFKEFMERLRAEQLQLFGNYQKNNFLAALIDLGHDTSDFNQSQWQKYMKESLGNPFYIDEPWLTPRIDNWANENFDLIKRLSDDYIKRVNTIVSNGVQGGTLTKDIQ